MKTLEKMSKNLSIVLVLSMLAVLFAPACNVTAEAVDAGASATVTVSEVSVEMAVFGLDGEVLYDSANTTEGAITVTDENEWGLSVLGALDASGAGYETGYWSDWDMYYVSDVADSNYEEGIGWMYAVNGETAMVSAENCQLKDGDQIVWYYITDMEQEIPAWADVSVEMAVIGLDGEVLYDSTNTTAGAITVTRENEWGLSVLGALDASGAGYETGYWSDWDMYYVSDVADSNYEEGIGWMYAVNGETAMVSAENCQLKAGDQIVWYYITDMEQQPPVWGDATVDMKVIGLDGEVLYDSTSTTAEAITVNCDSEWGKSVLSAMDVSGLDYETGFCPVWGDYLSSIEGLASDATFSWMYSVNDGDLNAAVKAGSDIVRNGDQIVWEYTDDEPVNASELGDAAVEFLYQDYLDRGFKDIDEGVGTYALYVLDEANVNYDAWELECEKYTDALISAVEADISNESEAPVSIKKLVQDLAAMKAMDQRVMFNQLVELIQARDAEGFSDSNFSVFYAYDLLRHLGMLDIVDGAQAKEYIMSRMNTEDVPYTWGFDYGSYYVDYISTVQCLRVLNCLDPNGEDTEIQEVISIVLEWIENSQLSDGSFVPEGGYEAMNSPMSFTAYTIDVMDAFGMDFDVWTSESGKTGVDYLVNNSMNSDGSFGKSGDVYCALAFLKAYCMIDDIFYLDTAAEIIEVGDNLEINAMLKGINGIDEVTDGVVWTVVDESIVEVNDGVVTGLMEGETTVQATYNGSMASAIITVEAESSGGGSWEEPSELKVSMAVVGIDGEILVEPSSFKVKDSEEWGLTVLGALIESGVDYHLSTWSWGWLVDSVAGLDGGSGGWMYAVNDISGSVIGKCADVAEIKNGDEIVWYYATSMEDQPPMWSDLEKASSSSFGGSVIALGDADTVSDKELRNALEDAESAGQVSFEADSSKTALAVECDQFDKIVDSEKCLEVTVQGARFFLSPECLKLMRADSSDYENIQFMAEKLSDWEIENHIAPFNGKLRLAGDIYEFDIMTEDSDGELQKVCDMTDCTIVIGIPEGFRQAAEAGTLMDYWYDEENEKWQYTGGVCDAENMTMSFKVKHFSKYALLSSTASFDDVFGHWAQKEIEFMAANEYVNGVGENAFDAQSSITRVQFVAILARMSGLEVDYDNMKTFSDVGGDAWYSREVNIAVSNGIVNGVDAERFDPDGLVTREQIVTMIKRYLDIVGDSQSDETVGNAILSRFADGGEISTWAEEAVAFAVNEELVKGRGADKFVPGGNATRAEAAVMLFRMLQWMLS